MIKTPQTTVTSTPVKATVIKSSEHMKSFPVQTTVVKSSNELFRSLPTNNKNTGSQTKHLWSYLKNEFNETKLLIRGNPILFNMEPKIMSWELAWNKRKGALGLCNYRKKTIEISIYMLWGNADKNVLKNTLLHEFAHALTPHHKHDEVWVKIAKQLGCDGKRCSSDTTLHNTVAHKYSIKCRSAGDIHFIMKRHKMPSAKTLNRWRCPTCKDQLVVYSSV